MTEKRILHIEISTPEAAMEEFAQTWDRLERGVRITPVEAVGFQMVTEILDALAPRRWDLIQTLKRQGPMGVDALAGTVKRDRASVTKDVEALAALGILEQDKDRRVSVPWDEIDLRIPLAA